MPSQSSAAEPKNPLTLEARAAALWTFVQGKSSRFSHADALQVLRDLELHEHEDTKSLAKRLRVALLRRGVGLKHTHALQAASRIAGYSSFHEDNSVGAPRLRLTVFRGPGLRIQEEMFATWNDLTGYVRDVLDFMATAENCVLGIVNVTFTGEDFEFTIPVPPGEDKRDQRVLNVPFFRVEKTRGADWLDGAAAFVEKVRRHLEERGKAVLDGSEVVHLCAHRSPARGMPGEGSLVDVPNTELVLLREGSEDDPASGVEIARGDEVTCWHQLELSMRDDRTNDMPALSITVAQEGVGAWLVNGRRYVWALETLHPKEYVPGRTTTLIGPPECDRLLRRYRLAKRIHGKTFKHHVQSKELRGLPGRPKTCRVDLPFLLSRMQEAGLTWEKAVAKYSPFEKVGEQQPVLPLFFVVEALHGLKLQDPNSVFALPNLSEMVRVVDDGLLRALLPRVQSVRAVRPGDLSEEDNQRLDAALEEFSAGRRLQSLSAHGDIRVEQEAPYVVHASEARKLLETVVGLGLTMYAGLMPHLLSTAGLAPARIFPGPWAPGTALFVRFERPSGC